MKYVVRNIIYIVLLCGYISCGGEEKEIPGNIIPEDKMIEVITEVELTQALIKLKFSQTDTIEKQQLFNQVYEQFDVSEEQFNLSLDYYCKKPKQLHDMYIEVISKLSERQAEEQLFFQATNLE